MYAASKENKVPNCTVVQPGGSLFTNTFTKSGTFTMVLANTFGRDATTEATNEVKFGPSNVPSAVRRYAMLALCNGFNILSTVGTEIGVVAGTNDRNLLDRSCRTCWPKALILFPNRVPSCNLETGGATGTYTLGTAEAVTLLNAAMATMAKNTANKVLIFVRLLFENI